MKPRIAITAWLGPIEGKDRLHLPLAYADAVAAAGGLPVVIPPVAEPSAEHLLAVADGLVLAGGNDLDSALWGEPLHPKATRIPPRRQRADLAWLQAADDQGLPVLGICLGCQEMAVHRGGRIIQHVADEPGAGKHRPEPGGADVFHPVTVEPQSVLARAVGPGPLEVNSSHHQAVREPGRGLRVVARSPDGLIEAIEDPSPGRFFLGVQWHPERIFDRPRHLALFQALCVEATARPQP